MSQNNMDILTIKIPELLDEPSASGVYDDDIGSTFFQCLDHCHLNCSIALTCLSTSSPQGLLIEIFPLPVFVWDPLIVMVDELEEIMTRFSLSSNEVVGTDLGDDDVRKVVFNCKKNLIGKNLRIHWVSRDVGTKIGEVLGKVVEVLIPHIGGKDGKHLKISVNLDISQPLLRGTIMRLGKECRILDICSAWAQRLELRKNEDKTENITGKGKPTVRNFKRFARQALAELSSNMQIDVHQGKRNIAGMKEGIFDLIDTGSPKKLKSRQNSEGCCRVITSRDGNSTSTRSSSCVIILSEVGKLKVAEAEGKYGSRGSMIEDVELIQKAMFIARANNCVSIEVQSSNTHLIQFINARVVDEVEVGNLLEDIICMRGLFVSCSFSLLNCNSNFLATKLARLGRLLISSIE
ncbi:hypothetical protein ACH5RR_030025 [Cinchona calisaya]|uniref:RNase H type-1 domain-containing protein n=1 Tax=Cinchona calisaya TaxID=153742 RepID=A0ABD2YWJ7_9GENT